jgi:hypothetical protein
LRHQRAEKTPARKASQSKSQKKHNKKNNAVNNAVNNAKTKLRKKQTRLLCLAPEEGSPMAESATVALAIDLVSNFFITHHKVPESEIKMWVIGIKNKSSDRTKQHYPLKCTTAGEGGWTANGSETTNRAGKPLTILDTFTNREDCRRFELHAIEAFKSRHPSLAGLCGNTNAGGGGTLGLKSKDEDGHTCYKPDPEGHVCYFVHKTESSMKQKVR